MQENARPVEDFYQVELVQQSGEGSQGVAQKFLIGQALGGGEIAKRAAEASSAFGVAVRAFAGVAARLEHPGKGKSSPEQLAQPGQCNQKPERMRRNPSR